MNNFISSHPWMFFWMVVICVYFLCIAITSIAKAIAIKNYTKLDKMMTEYLNMQLREKLFDYQLQAQRELDKKLFNKKDGE